MASSPTRVDRAHDLRRRAAELFERGRWDDVIVLLADRIPAGGDTAGLVELLAESYRAADRPEEARQALSNGLETAPSPQLHVLLGKVHRDGGDHETALECYLDAIRLDDACHQAWCQYGLVAEHLGRLDDARKAYRRALAEAPDDGLYLLCAGKAALAAGDPTEAAELFGRARTALRAAGADGAYNLACLESISGNLDAALEDFASFLARHPHAFAWAEQDADLAALRSHPGFRALKEQSTHIGAADGSQVAGAAS